MHGSECSGLPRVGPVLLFVGLALLSGSVTWGQPRVLPAGQTPADVRLQPVKDLDGYFPFQPAASPEAWTRRAEVVRRQILVSLGLWPMPSRTPLNSVVHGRVERGDYTVEKVYFESMPGLLVTGNLYRPKDRPGKRPGVLCPHGHWANGRFLDSGAEEVRREIASGAERFEEGGRSVLQARCVQLARMGCVVFHYDMLGYADSVQIPMAVAHQFAKQRPEMNARENWGLFSPQAEAQAQSVMGLQTWNSVRALDFLLGLEDVDPVRIGVTGASGGGTQTFILGAIDPRPAVAFPAVMVSTAMQGGCTCENACGLRIDTGNVEFAALFAPRPLGLTAADDWTKEMPAKGFPELQRHYAMLGAADRVMLKPLLHFGHNYNHVSRTVMYAWFNRHFGLGLPEPILEADYQRLSRAEMSVWDDAHPVPPGGPDFERKLLRWWAEDVDRQLRQLAPGSAEFRQVVGGGVAAIIGRGLPEAGELEWQSASNQPGMPAVQVGLLRNKACGEELPVVVVQASTPGSRVVVWLTSAGKAGLWIAGAGEAGTAAIRPEVQSLAAAGVSVIGVDLSLQGEFLGDGLPVTQTRRVKNPREAAAYTFGYNRSLFAQRVHDVLTVIGGVRAGVMGSFGAANAVQVNVLGVEGAGPWVAAARAVAGDAMGRAVIDTQGFRFADVRDLQSPDFLPGAARYLDLPGMVALGAPGRLLLAGEGVDLAAVPEVIRTAYSEAGEALTLAPAGAGELLRTAVAWLLAR